MHILDKEGLDITVVMLPRTPRLLASLLQGRVFEVARAGEPSPFAACGDVQRGS